MFREFPFTKILAWYEKNGRHNLPWRKIYDLPAQERLYKVWIAEVMLQQTQVDRVISYYSRFLEKYPTIESLAGTSYEELFPYYQGLWYYWRARRMIELAKSVVEEYEWIFPNDFEKLRKLPWIGKYTAQALLAFGYDEPVLAMDANLQKIFARYYYGSKYLMPMKKEKRKKKNGWSGNDCDTLVYHLEEQLKNTKESSLSSTFYLLPSWSISGRAINNALMDFGALVSTTWDKLDKENYPLRDCRWFQTEWREEPVKKKVMKKSEKWAKLVVFVHEAHKVYWSSLSSSYEPFLIEPTGSDDRRTVQDYFSATFGLEVSVRPSFWSGTFDGIPVKLFHAQIQTGTLKQKTFSKSAKEEWTRENIKD